MGLLQPHGRYRDRDGAVPLNPGLPLHAAASVVPVTGSTGVLAGIARHARPRGPMEVVDAVDVSVERGVEGDCRGLVKPGGRGRRQVTAMARAAWEQALAELDPALTHDLRWQDRRANLLVDGLALPQVAGARLRIGAAVVLHITMECDPCQRMDALRPGLRQALTPDWRGGVCTRVLAGGRIALGDIIRIEEA